MIVGKYVNSFYEAITKQLGGAQRFTIEERKKGIVSQVLELISSALSPLIPAILGAGFLSIVLALTTQFGLLSTTSNTYAIINGIANCVYYFFPVLIAYSFAQRMKVNQVFAIIAACFLLYPDFINLLQNGDVQVHFLGIPIMYVSYSKQIIPIFFMVHCQKQIEALIDHWIPKSLKAMIGSALILTLTIAVTILVFGPLGNLMTQGLNALVYVIVDRCGWVAIPIMSFLNPFFLATGLGSANFPIMLMSYVNNGYEALILPAALAGNAVQAGCGFSIFLKSRNKEFRSVSLDCAITSLMGITEPIIFSVHYRLKKTFLIVMFGSAIAAILPGVTGVACYALATGILSIPAYLPGGMMNMIWAIASLLLDLLIGFLLTYFIKWEEPSDDVQQVQ